jgi:hypothetical protein
MADWLVWDGGSLTADVVTAITDTATVEVTDHPVETGSTISDHVQRIPKTIQVEFAQSTLPLKFSELTWKQHEISVRPSAFVPSGLLAVSMMAGAVVGAAASLVGLGGEGPQTKIWSLTAKDEDKDRIQELHDQLLDLLDGGTTVTFVFGERTLSGYVLTEVRRTVQAGSGGLARFSVSAKHVQTVATSSLSALGGLPIPDILSVIPLLDLGAKGVDKTAEEQYERSLGASDLSLDSLGGVI